MSIAVVLIVALICVFSLYRWIVNRHIWTLARKIPGPQALPIFGNLLSFQKSQMETFLLIRNFFQIFGSVYRMWVGPYLVVFLRDADDVQQVLGNSRMKNRDTFITPAIIPFLGVGLVTARDEQWKTHRKLLTPIFNFKVMESYVKIFGQKSAMLVDVLNELADGRTFNVCEYLTTCTFDSICETTLGRPVQSESNTIEDLKISLFDAGSLIFLKWFKPWLYIEWLNFLTADGRKSETISKKLNDFTDRVISQKLTEYHNGVPNVSLENIKNKKVLTTLEMLIESGESQGSLLTPLEIRDEMKTLAATGLGTTATALSFFLLLVAVHPDIQTLCQEELETIFGDDDRMATVEDIKQMSYINRVIKEQLRLFPVAPIVPREVMEDIILPSGYTLPVGSSVIVCPFDLHRDPKYFPEPERFYPDRWLEENVKELHPFAYIPFSAGPRNCIGQKYALLQMKSIISILLRKFQVRTEYKMEDLYKIQIGISITLVDYKIKLIKRSRN